MSYLLKNQNDLIDIILEANTSQSISLEKLQKSPELICIFNRVWIDSDVNWLIYWILRNELEYFFYKNMAYCLVSRENVISLLSQIVKIVKTNDPKVSEEGLPETCIGYRKPYDLNYMYKLKFFYNTVRPYLNTDEKVYNQFLLIIKCPE